MTVLNDNPDVVFWLDYEPDDPQCECRHDAGFELVQCPERAEVRVTVVCAEPGCNCGASVHLVCAECLASWERTARANGVRLRVRPL